MGLPVHKSPDFVFHQEVPPSGGPPLKRLIDEFVTPEPDFFLRTHGSIAEFDYSTFGLTVAGLVTRPHRFSLKELRGQFPLREMVATLHCAGNRRSSASAIKAVPNEVGWGNDAISNAVWTGCSLAEVLHFGYLGQAKHVDLYAGLGFSCEHATRKPKKAS